MSNKNLDEILNELEELKNQLEILKNKLNEKPATCGFCNEHCGNDWCITNQERL